MTAALCCVLRAVEVGAAYPTTWWLAALACVAGGFLTKWTAPAFFYLTIGPLLVWRGQWRLLFGWRHLLAVGLATGLCTAWAVTVAEQVGWDVLRDTVGREATQRFAPGGRGKPYPWVESLSFPAVVLGANAPWSLLALFALRPTFFRQWDTRGQLVLQLLHCWAWPNLLFWSLPAQHNVRYVMPICPAFVGLGVMVLLSGESRWRETTRVLLKPRTLFWGGLIAWAVVKIAFVAVVVPGRTAERNARATGTEIARLVPAGEILYLCRLKDEGVLFYYGRPARRFTFDQPPVEGPFYALLLDAEWGMRDTFTSGAGSSSYWVTTGPAFQWSTRTGILKLAVSDNGQAEFPAFLDRFTEHIALPEAGGLGLQFRVVEGPIAFARPDDEVFGAAGLGGAGNLASVKTHREARVVGRAAELRSGGADLQTDEAALKPRRRCRGVRAEESAENRKCQQNQMNEALSHEL